MGKDAFGKNKISSDGETPGKDVPMGDAPKRGEALAPAWILSGFMLLWLCMAMVVLPRVNGPIILPDEFGYWTHAARMAGMDWTRVVSTHSWYSFGYGLLIFPFMELAADPVMLYRCMVGVNILLMGAAALFLYGTLAKIFDGTDRRLPAIVSGGAMLYVSCATYAQTTMAESLLVFLYVLLAWGMLRWFMDPAMGNGILVVLTAGYMYMVHMRTIGIVLATLISMAAAEVFRKKASGRWRRAVCLLSAVCILILLTGVVKEMLVGMVASESYSSMVQHNSYSGQWGKVMRLFSLDGMWRFLAGLAGKLFYLGCASFGLYYWGMFFLVRRAAGLLAAWVGHGDVRSLFFLWILLSHGAALLISGISTLGSGRLDGILYGRYHENTVPLIIAFGMAELLARPGFRKRLLWLLGMLGMCFFVVYTLLGTGEVRYMNLHSVSGIMYAAALADRYDTKVMLYAYLGGMVGGMVTLAAFRLTGGGRRRRGLLLVFCLLQLGLSCYNSYSYTLPAYAGQEGDVELLLTVRRMTAEGEGSEMPYPDGDDRKIPYLYDGKGTQVYLAQYILRDIPLQPVSWEVLPGQETGNLILLQKGDGVEGMLPEGYTGVMESARYVVYRYGP